MNIQGKFIHPAIQATVEFWCGEIAKSASAEKLEIFRETLSLELAKLYDSAEGIIEVHAKVPNLKRYTIFEKPNQPSGVLQRALKKAKLKPLILTVGTAVQLSTTVVKVLRRDDGENDEDNLTELVIWKLGK